MTTALRTKLLAISGLCLGLGILSGPAWAQSDTDTFTVYFPAEDSTAGDSSGSDDRATRQASLSEAAEACGVSEEILATWNMRYCVAVEAGRSAPAAE